MGHGKIRTKGKWVVGKFMTNMELRSVGTTNEKKNRNGTIVSSGKLMGSVGTTNRKKRESGTTCVTKGI